MAAIMAVCLTAFWATGDGYRSGFGPLKGGDFIALHTFGAAGRSGDTSLLYDVNRLHQLQVQLVPQSAPETYLPVYPPQVFLLFAPISVLPYGVAAALWTLLTIATYGGAVYAIWRSARDALPDGRFVAMAAAAFPPFFSLVLHSHNTMLVLAAFFLAYLAMERDRRFAAGLVLGVLFFKPTFGVALAVVVLVSREWRMLGGLALAAALQIAAVAAFLDLSAFGAYVDFAQAVGRHEYLIEPKPAELHSLRSLLPVAPGWLRTAVWITGSAVVLYGTVRAWASAAPVAVRMGVLVLASVLVNPHLFVYDAAVLALPLLWFGIWVERNPVAHAALAARYWASVGALFATFLLPFANVIFVQLSVIVMFRLHVLVLQAIQKTTASAKALV